ncbi:protein kinase subdomain-containing protein PKL CAK Fmp29 [Amylocystis lapponica]|nr:protein kinase subdomain-containing protein PKL CAK Fmp29 [Amylocystis lapponica]
MHRAGWFLTFDPFFRLSTLVFDFLAVPVSQYSLCRPHSSPRRSFPFTYSSSIAIRTRWPPCRAFSMTAHLQNDLFDYTSGRWIVNDALRHAERRRIFNVDGLRQLAALSVERSPGDIVDLKKLAEGGFNRTFLITMRDNFQMVARIPYPATIPKKLAVASEVATMALLRSSGLPIPEVYGYSTSTDNTAETEYIFMQFVQGTSLSDIWFDLGERDPISMSRQITELESKMMSIAFPAGGSLYYSKDLEKVAGIPGIPLEDERFCVGPDTRLPLWYGRRAQLDVDRGSYQSVEAAFVRGADKELAYLKQFGRPLLPFQRVRREGYQYKEQPPSDHIENLDRYLLIAPNIIVSRSPDSNLHVVGLIDWQHTSILPLFLLAGIPQQLQNNYDIVSQSMTQQSGEVELHRRRLVHYHYIQHTEEYNELHYAALADPIGLFRRRLFRHASGPWEGETLSLKIALIDATENWEMLTGGVASCPVVFDPDDVRETRELDKEQREADASLEACRDVIGHGPEGWVPVEYYEEAMARSKKLKQDGLAAAESEAERAQVEAHWPFNDMVEEEYM